MIKSDFGRTVATLVCTLVMSATCVIGAIAPADASRHAAPNPTLVAAARPLA